MEETSGSCTFFEVYAVGLHLHIWKGPQRQACAKQAGRLSSSSPLAPQLLHQVEGKSHSEQVTVEDLKSVGAMALLVFGSVRSSLQLS